MLGTIYVSQSWGKERGMQDWGRRTRGLRMGVVKIGGEGMVGPWGGVLGGFAAGGGCPPRVGAGLRAENSTVKDRVKESAALELG